MFWFAASFEQASPRSSDPGASPRPAVVVEAVAAAPVEGGPAAPVPAAAAAPEATLLALAVRRQHLQQMLLGMCSIKGWIVFKTWGAPIKLRLEKKRQEQAEQAALAASGSKDSLGYLVENGDIIYDFFFSKFAWQVLVMTT